MKFTYRCGQQPLPGYTIKRGIGWGGFGEVYFAVSDSGKEVALKWIRSNLDVELRGVQQCLNLKHPHLVHLYDLRTDAVGQNWLVMEYVSGEPLGAILSRHPNGLAPELACEWFQGLASAVHYLHEHGIVHRDLKPGNIFLENGVIKVGDYGLCKTIGESQHAGMTQNVGTVHYMAPEVTTGNYNRQIDIYAAGVILFELVTGHVPFDGHTAGEVQMKHLTSTPNFGGLPPELRPILERALAKNPANRYASMADMSRKVQAVLRGEPMAAPKPAPRPAPPPPRQPERKEPIPVVKLVPVVLEDTPPPAPEPPVRRFADLCGMLVWSVALSALFASAWALFVRHGLWSALTETFFLTAAASWAVILPSRLWGGLKTLEDSWTRRLVLMCCGFAVGLFGLWLDGYALPLPWSATGQVDSLQPWAPPDGDMQRHRSFFTALYPENRSMPLLACYLGYFGLMFLVLRWWKSTEATRSKRFSLKPVIATLFWGYILLFMLPSTDQRHTALVAMALTSTVVQTVSPWRERIAVLKRKCRLPAAARAGRVAS
jgi:eukaryotic-like serine/threonine-protein kinase